MEKARIKSGHIFCIILIITCCSLVSNALFDVYSGVALYINIVFVFLLLIIGGSFQRNDLMMISLMAAYSILTLMLTQGGLGSVLLFVLSLLWILVYKKIVLTEKIISFIKLICLITIIFIYVKSLNYAENYRYYLLIEINPNTLGGISLYTYTIWFALTDFSNVKNKLLGVILTVVSIISMVNCSSRMTVVSLICYLVLILFPAKFSKPKFFMNIVLLILLIGTLFPFVYLYLYDIGFNLEFLGKSLYTGRESIWSAVFSLLQENPGSIIWGLGSKAQVWGDNNTNVHNNYFAIFVNYGILGYVMYFGYILYTIKKICNADFYDTKKKLLSMYIACVLILGFTETTSSWVVTFIFAFFGLGIACNQNAIDVIDLSKSNNNTKRRKWRLIWKK